MEARRRTVKVNPPHNQPRPPGTAGTSAPYSGQGRGHYRRERVRHDVEDAVRCAFRENQDWDVSQVYPRSRFSLSQLDRELHELLADLRSVEFNRAEDIVSGLSLPVLASLAVRLGSEP